jgi:hypothetical protein
MPSNRNVKKCHICKKEAFDKLISIPHESSSRKTPVKDLNIYLCAEHLHKLLSACMDMLDWEERRRLVEIIRSE